MTTELQQRSPHKHLEDIDILRDKFTGNAGVIRNKLTSLRIYINTLN